MRRRCILVGEFDLYRHVGGGQTVYRRLIELQPDTDFVYFRRDEAIDAGRPSNTSAIPYLDLLHGHTREIPRNLEPFYDDYEEASRIASSAMAALGPRFIDVVDVPDYTVRALFIRTALERVGFRVGIVSLALHGVVSASYTHWWPTTRGPSRQRATLRVRERLQFRAVDARYAISNAYACRWERIGGQPVNRIDPLCMVEPIEPVLGGAAPEQPRLVFVGRRERQKGPDIYVDLAWCLREGSCSEILVVGSEAVMDNGVGSAEILEDVARRRRIDVNFVGARSRAELETIYRSRSIIVVSSRSETFSLVAIEALRVGCPVFVTEDCGAADWIRTNLPELTDLVLPLDCGREAATPLRDAVWDYDGLRRRVVAAISAARLRADVASLGGMYAPAPLPDIAARQTLNDIQRRFDSLNRPYDLAQPSVRRNETARTSPSPGWAEHWLHGAETLDDVRALMLRGEERTRREIDRKLHDLTQLAASNRLARVGIFREMARLERRRGRDLTAATYCLRVMRWTGRDPFGDLPFVARTFDQQGFTREAAAATAMFGQPTFATRRCRELLDDQLRAQLTKPDLQLEILDDRRGDVEPTASVIVSLYNAEAKLDRLLRHLGTQSLASVRRLEIVLVDSGSPTNERGVFQGFASRSDLPILYARSAKRETIQAAWNRGIKLARAPYLAFLGADEGIHPDCLEILSRELDRRPDIDWAMGDSVVTDVDHNGRYVGDVMMYDRRGLSPELVRLETTYLSWVGGLYRRTIHDRFGYYDESFRAAGDTEFKGRLLSKLRIAHVPKTLGVFNNYPEARTTASPAAEIEDLRAWYLHRTTAGIAYAYDDLPIEDAWSLFAGCLGYRKSYVAHQSTDFDLAAAVADYLRSREGPGDALEAANLARHGLAALRTLDALDLSASRQRHQNDVRTFVREFTALAETAARKSRSRPTFHGWNDNRYEQHWWSWS